MAEAASASAHPAPSAQERILGIVTNHWQGRAVAIASELELADLLADAPLQVDELAKRTSTHAPSLFRVLRALECTGIPILGVAMGTRAAG
jgi:hypothetical protein